jgi:putative isomerase
MRWSWNLPVLLVCLVVGPWAESIRAEETAPLPMAPAASSLHSCQDQNPLAQKVAGLSPRDVCLLKRAQQILEANLRLKAGWQPYRGIEPSPESYKGIWNWDAAFHAMAVSHWDPKLAREQFDILFSRQQPNGALPDVIWENGDIVTTITKPPVMAWAIAVVDHRSPDTQYLGRMYPKLVQLGEFFLNERGGAKDGLFYYAGADEGADSGWDDAIRWDNGYRYAKDNSHRLWAVDLNCYMVMHYRALAYIAGRLNLSNDRDKWTHAAELLSERINSTLWDEQIGFYVDRDRVTGQPGPALSPAGFMPLFLRIANKQQAARIEKLASDPEKFYPGMPTAAYDTPGFKSKGYWRGSTWLNTAYFALKGLDEYGYSDTALKMRSRLLDTVAHDPSTIWEYYDSKDGSGAGAKSFGWSAAFTIAFILDWNDAGLTWLF